MPYSNNKSGFDDTHAYGEKLVQLPVARKLEQKIARVKVSTNAAENEDVVQKLHPRIAAIIGGRKLTASFIALGLEEVIVEYLTNLEPKLSLTVQKAKLRQWAELYTKAIVHDTQVRAATLRELKNRPRQ